MLLRAVVICLAVTVAFTAATSAYGQSPRAAAGGDVELVDGDGRAVVALRGSLIGRLAEGRITITDLPSGTSSDVLVQGDVTAYEVDARTTVYVGSDLRFRVFRGKWRVRIQGQGLFASAVGVGTVGLAGTGGTFAIEGASPRPWPVEYQVFRLGS